MAKKKKRQGRAPKSKNRKPSASKTRRGPRYSEEERKRRRRMVADMYVQGHTQKDIAERLGVSDGQVSLDLKAYHEEWAERTSLSVDEYKRDQLAKLEKLEAAAWARWEKSIGPHKKRRYGESPNGSVDVTEEEELNGEPRYLDEIRKIIERRCKILGLDAPAKTEGVWYGKMSISEAVAAAARPEGDET